jgi:G3E family GTPase
MSPILITVFTGFLGAGKTTTILALLKKLPKDCKVVLLKNEFGDIEVDSKLAQQSSVVGVSEILNGCLSVIQSLFSDSIKKIFQVLCSCWADAKCVIRDTRFVFSFSHGAVQIDCAI